MKKKESQLPGLIVGALAVVLFHVLRAILSIFIDPFLAEVVMKWVVGIVAVFILVVVIFDFDWLKKARIIAPSDVKFHGSSEWHITAEPRGNIAFPGFNYFDCKVIDSETGRIIEDFVSYLPKDVLHIQLYHIDADNVYFQELVRSKDRELIPGKRLWRVDVEPNVDDYAFIQVVYVK